MGHIIMPSEAFVRALSEDAGSRSGFALGEADILEHLDSSHQFVSEITSRNVVRIASTDYADKVGDLLFALGASRTAGMPPLSSRFLWHIGEELGESFDLRTLMRIESYGNAYARFKVARDASQQEALDGLKGLLSGHSRDFLSGLLAAIEEEIALNPFYVRHERKFGLLPLEDLFHSERLPADEHRFFDQRFIDYLDRNRDTLKSMHWRQFEGLAAEWFQRQGYSVEMGPGRNDGGVDLRLWKDSASESGPPTIIVQCKRHKHSIDKVTVKALYSDVLFEKAEGGMIVTTSDISHGAKKDIEAREYPITGANLEAVTRWVEKMRTPGTGFLNFSDPPSSEHTAN